MSAVRHLCSLALCVALLARVTSEEARTRVFAEFTSHPALRHLDLNWCGAFSRRQTSRGPIGCGHPEVGEHPWMAVLGYRRPHSDQPLFACSGVLISRQVVLTSAACAAGAPDHPLEVVRLAEHDLKARLDCIWYAPEECQQAQDVAVRQTLLHPDFVPGAAPGPHDLGLVALAEPVGTVLTIIPICLPMFTSRDPAYGRSAVSFGLNRGDRLVADDNATCCDCSRRQTRGFLLDAERLLRVGTPHPVGEPCQYRLLQGEGHSSCLGGERACVADLGSPYVAADRFGLYYYVMGVAVSRPFQTSCVPGVPVLYASVIENIEWILDGVDSLSLNQTQAE